MKKELAALVNKAMQLIKKQKLKLIEPGKKCKVKWHSDKDKKEEEELCALDAELKDFTMATLTSWSSTMILTRRQKMEKLTFPFPMRSLSERQVMIRQED